MTTDSSRLGPPLNLSGAALWFGRNFLEALIWASTGAAVLLLVLATYRFPQVAVWTLLAVLFIGGLAWRLFGARRPEGPTPFSPASGVHFHMFGFSVWVARERHGNPQGDRP